MIPPKYNFYIGAIKTITLRSGRLSPDNKGVLEPSSYYYSSDILAVPKSGVLYITNSPEYQSVAYIICYNSSKTYASYDFMARGVKHIDTSRFSYYAISFQYNDSAFINNNFLAELTAVNPHYKTLSKKYAKENSQEFFRISLEGKIVLFGDDYEIVNTSNLENRFIFTIDKYNRTSDIWAEYYIGEFNKTDCKFDYDKKSCELKLTTIDRYNEVLNKYENTYDLIKLAPEITKINLHKRSLIQVYVRGASSISNFFGGIYWEDDVNEAIDDHNALVNKYYFAYLKAGNEFYVQGAKESRANGVYAGINGYWSCWNGYTCKMELDSASSTDGVKRYFIRIYRNSDNKLLYQSKIVWTAEDDNNKYIGREDIEMVNVDDDTDSFIIRNPFVYHIYQRILCDVDTVLDSESEKSTYDLPIDDFVTDNRNYKKCIGLQGGLFFCTSRTTSTPTRFGQNDYGEYFTNQFIPTSAGVGRPLPISRNSWANASLWYVYEDLTYEYFEEQLRKQYTLRDSYSIAAAIKALLNKIDPTLRHEATATYSHFLYDTSVPLSNMNRFYVYITQKTNILKGEYDQPAQKAETSLEDLMKMLRDCFRCYWYIENNMFKIEHIYFFMNGGSYSSGSSVQLDFTKLTDQFNKKPTVYFQTEIEYDKSDLNQRYEFNWMDDVTDLFAGVAIDVKSNYIQKDKNEKINISQFSSDVDYMLFNPSAFSNDGFALLCPIRSNVISNLYKRATNIGYIKTDGVSVKSGDDNWRYTDYIPVDNTMRRIDCYLKAHSAISSITAYDSSKKVISACVHSVDNGVLNTTIYLPSNAKYIRICGGSDRFAGFTQYANVKPETDLTLPIISVELIDEDGETYDAIIQNWYAAWAYLVRFYMYDMPASNIECNVLHSLPVYGIKMCMEYTIEFPTENDLNELQLIKTNVGNGKIDEYSVNIDTRLAKVKLVYYPK